MQRSTALIRCLSPQYEVPDEVDDATAAQFTVSVVRCGILRQIVVYI